MEQELKIEPSEELAYWVGVAQSDGCLYKYLDRGKTVQFRIVFGVHLKSLPMLERFRDISKILLNRDGKIIKTKKVEWVYHIGVKSLLPYFDKLDIKFGKFIPPAWTLEKSEFFGAYLAGIIDGDGTIGIKRPKYPQCLISITSGSVQVDLERAIKDIMKCSVFQMEHYQKRFIKTLGRIVEGKWWHLEFCVSSKTAEFVLEHILPHLQLEYKRKKLETFILERYSSVIEN